MIHHRTYSPQVSSLIAALAYNDRTFELKVTLRNETHYVYEDVPNTVWTDFQNAQSLGTFYNRMVKGVYSRLKAAPDSA